MNKAPDAFLTIGETAERLRVKTHILRYWEEQFPMLKPLKRAGGRRLYRPADIALLEQIQELLDRKGYTIRGARALLAQKGDAGGDVAVRQDASATPRPERSTAVDLFPPHDEAAMLARLQAIRTKLAQALSAA